ncbi:DUF721 domain-containing protein [Nisaea sp.]|uniref:DUF721 domain-containing protein n=1 Tax=Nisaea sp. TaxID=2024842 RepID=UPI002B2731C8|nr:DciA family protein [Nisaea sp.]
MSEKTAADKTLQPSTWRRRIGGLARLAAVAPTLSDKALRRRGFAESRIISDWPAIVGEVLSLQCAPEKMVFARGATGGGTLHLRVAGAAALEIQHQIPVLIERINMVFGYSAIARIALKQGPLPKRRESLRPKLRPLKPEEVKQVTDSVAGVERNDLRQALEDLGKAVVAAGAKGVSRKRTNS